MNNSQRPEPKEIDQQAYIDDERACPNCHKRTTNRYHTTLYKEKCMVYWVCYNCEAKWLEEFNLTLVRHQKQMIKHNKGE